MYFSESEQKFMIEAREHALAYMEVGVFGQEYINASTPHRIVAAAAKGRPDGDTAMLGAVICIRTYLNNVVKHGRFKGAERLRNARITLAKARLALSAQGKLTEGQIFVTMDSSIWISSTAGSYAAFNEFNRSGLQTGPYARNALQYVFLRTLYRSTESEYPLVGYIPEIREVYVDWDTTYRTLQASDAAAVQVGMPIKNPMNEAAPRKGMRRCAQCGIPIPARRQEVQFCDSCRQVMDEMRARAAALYHAEDD